MGLKEEDYVEIYRSCIGGEIHWIYGGVISKLETSNPTLVIEEFLAAFKYLYANRRIRLFEVMRFGGEKVFKKDKYYAVAYWEDDPDLIVSIIRKWMLSQNVDWNEAYTYKFFDLPGIEWFKEDGEVFYMFDDGIWDRLDELNGKTD
ncbi:hypothetical protein C943_01382 [Mariniradius saccharolyticus AK6]|uniref:Uncharacterized protein n=1 Tax=Mariniradius saccharolyticus AK6 TaxID=1239962 RepID=M7X3Q1_9BACT|nr:hypothetical protein [Mariniradius saccharolyticus]EMS32120.1 hypothetical protein C943_01382 [Mariniradius saccharolyticus AK6]